MKILFGRPQGIAFLLILLRLGLLQSAQAARSPWTSSRIQGSPEPPPLCTVERLFPKVELKGAVDLLWHPTTSRYWVLEQNGAFYSFANQPGAETVSAGSLAKDDAGNARPVVQALGFAFHPGFATNRYVFFAYQATSSTNDGSRLSRFRLVLEPTPRLDIGSELPIITWRGGGHNGCSVKFGPDGMLYFSTGDAESPEPPDRLRTGQDLSDLLASIVRIDVDHPDSGKNYGIPKDNPFRQRTGARPEIWAYGFRNPWRTSFGPDGALWLGDVGWEMWEMIHRVTSGYNGGWSKVEGPQTILGEILAPTPISPPAAAHPHSEAASITGGEFYQGKNLRELSGAYIYGDWETGKIWALWHDGTKTTRIEELCDTTLKIVSFATGADGEMLLIEYQDGNRPTSVHRLVRNQSATTTSSFPKRLSETGLFSDLMRQVPSSGVEEYRVSATMWADGATSQRWVALPGESVVTTARGHPWSEVSWAFPSNAVLAKTLSLEMTVGQPTSQRRIETQLLHYDGQGWQAYSYRWNDSGTDADLVPMSGAETTFRIRDPEAPDAVDGVREQSWRFHSRAECLRCHNFWPGNAIAFGWDSLSGKSLKGNAPSELDRLQEAGFLQITRGNEKSLRPLKGDATEIHATRDELARTWLHINCAHCHRFGAGAAGSTYFNAELPLKDLHILDVPPSRGTFGLPNARIIASGDPWRSVALYRAASTGAGHMPAIGSRRRDERGLDLLRDWITTLPVHETNRSATTAEILNAQKMLLETASGPNRERAMREAFTNAAVAWATLPASTLHAAQSDWLKAARQHPNPPVRDLARHLLRPDQRVASLGDQFDPSIILALTGDTERGRKLFQLESGPGCARCHRSEGQGRSYGPDLTEISRKYKPAEMLTHIIQPNLLVAPEYIQHQIETRDGISYSGFLTRTNNSSLTLVTESGENILSQSDIQRHDFSSQSAMPEGLLAPLTSSEAADLLAYLTRKLP